MSNKTPLEIRGQAFEASYFQKKEQALIDGLREVFHKKHSKQEIREATGITDEELLDRLVELELNGEMMAAFELLPVIEVAWAEGQPDAKTVRAVLEAGEANGIQAGTKAREMLEQRLATGPTADLRKVWYMYAGTLKQSLTPVQLEEFRDDLLGFCKSVAEASGGILGMVLKTSAREQRVMDEVKKGLS